MRHGWTNYPELPIDQAPESKLKYMFRFDWGSFRVTQEAHQAYQMIPLREGRITDNFPAPGDSSSEPATDIWLLSPSEFKQFPVSPSHLHNDFLPFVVTSKSFIHGSGLGLIISYGADRQATLEALRLNEDDETEPTSNQVFEEMIEATATPTLTHYLSRQISTETNRLTAEWQRREDNHRFLARLGAFGISAIASNGIIIAADAAEKSQFILPNTVLMAAATGFLGGTAIRDIYLFARGANRRELTIQSAAFYLAGQISGDIFETYSLDVFDDMAKDWPTTEEDPDP